MSNYNVTEARKRVGMDGGYCLCCDASNCCGELPSALDEIERLMAENNLIVTAALDIMRSWQYEMNPNEHKRQDFRRVPWHRIEALERAIPSEKGTMI